MKKSIKASVLVSLFLIAATASLQALGIIMKFVDITLENVEPGANFNLRVIRNLPLVVINSDDTHDTDVMVESVLPNANEMKEGYEPIPDPTWVKVVPPRFHLGPKASASSDVVVTVPQDQKLIGHHYEVILWAHTMANKSAVTGTGMMIQAGLRTRLRMSIGVQGPASLQREKLMKKLASVNTNFSISPDNIFVQNVPLGTPVDLKTLKKASLKVINESDDPVKLKFTSIIPDENILPQSGYSYAPDPKWIKVSPEVVETPGNAIKEVKLQVTIPNKPENRDKKYAFLIRTVLADESLPLTYNNIIYITTEP